MNLNAYSTMFLSPKLIPLLEKEINHALLILRLLLYAVDLNPYPYTQHLKVHLIHLHDVSHPL